MSLGWQTGRTEVRRCEVCGVEVMHREMACDTAWAPWWGADRHHALCGAWCMAGGIDREARMGSDLRAAVDASHRRMRCGTAGCTGGVR